MGITLYLAAFSAITIGVVHSVLGERYILTRLFRRNDLPKLFGGTEFTTRTLRFAWHITTVAWFGFAAVLVLLASDNVTPHSIALVVGVTFLTTAALTAGISRVKHLAWLVFLFIGCSSLYAAFFIK